MHQFIGSRVSLSAGFTQVVRIKNQHYSYLSSIKLQLFMSKQLENLVQHFHSWQLLFSWSLDSNATWSCWTLDSTTCVSMKECVFPKMWDKYISHTQQINHLKYLKYPRIWNWAPVKANQYNHCSCFYANFGMCNHVILCISFKMMCC